jgi:hypothetical protein
VWAVTNYKIASRTCQRKSFAANLSQASTTAGAGVHLPPLAPSTDGQKPAREFLRKLARGLFCRLKTAV